MTTYLAGIRGLLVIARNSAFTYKGKLVDVRQVGQQLGVRYAVEGSARRNGDVMRVTVQLVSTETGAHIFAGQFDVARDGAGYNVDDIVRQIATALSYRLVDVESARSYRERSQNPDVDDLVLHGRRAIRWRGYSPETQSEVVALLERAVALDPSSVLAVADLANALLDSIHRWSDPTGAMKLRRAKGLIERAELLRPDDSRVLWDRVWLLANEGRYDELIPAAQKAIEIVQNSPGPHQWLGMSLLLHGKPAEATVEFKQARFGSIPVRTKSIIVIPGIGFTLPLFMGQYDQAATWIEKSLAAGPNIGPYSRASYTAALAARSKLSAAMSSKRARLQPKRRACRPSSPCGHSSNTTSKIPRLWRSSHTCAAECGSLAFATTRTRTPTSACPSDDVLHTDYWSPTPITVPGARTIRTPDLQKLLEEQKALVLDTNRWGPSIPGAVGLWGAGIGGSLSDEYQDRLGRKMQQLTRGDRALPIVAMAFNSERYQGRNLALRSLPRSVTTAFTGIAARA